MGTTATRSLTAIFAALTIAVLALPVAEATSGSIITVFPSGDPAVDRLNILDAVEAAVGGDTVLLKGRGTNGAPTPFVLSEPLVVRGFSGTLKGEGSDSTVIRAVDRLIPDLDEKAFGNTGQIPSLLEFRYEAGGPPAELSIEGIKLVSEVETVPWGWGDQDGNNHLAQFIYVGAADYFAPAEASLDLSVDDVVMEGTHDSEAFHVGNSAWNGLVFAAVSGQFVMGDVAVSDVYSCGLVGQRVADAEVAISSVEAARTASAVCLISFQHSVADVSGVVTSEAGAVYVYQAHPVDGEGLVFDEDPLASEFLIRDNHVLLAPVAWRSGVELYDFAVDAEESSFVVTNNTLRSSGTAGYGLVFGLGISGLISDNTFVGSADYAIRVGSWWGWPTSSVHLLRNDFGGFEPTWSGMVVPPEYVSEIILTEFTSGNWVQGQAGDATSVVDLTDDPATERYDGANFLINVNGFSASPAADIKALIEENPGTDLADKGEDALAGIDEAVNELLKNPPDNQAAAGKLEGAVGDLEAAIKDKLFDDPTEGVAIAEGLLDVSRQLAVDAIDAAQDGDPGKIAEAEEYLERGDQYLDKASTRTPMRAAKKGLLTKAAAAYKDAVAKAEGA